MVDSLPVNEKAKADVHNITTKSNYKNYHATNFKKINE